MELKVKVMDIQTGGVLVAVVNKKDAAMFDLHSMDRIKIIQDDKIETVVIDTTYNDCVVRPGSIVVFSEAAKSLKLKSGQKVKIKMAKKPLSLEHIKKKLDGHRLGKEEIHQIIWDIVHNRLSEVEMTYFVAACYAHPMNTDETIALIHAMTHEGEILKVDRHPILDKHCIGGVAGNRTSMIIVPILAAAGVTIPKTSSRSITSPAGTADTMEVLCDVSVELKKMKRLVEKHNGCLVWGGSLNLAPADDKIIHVEKPLVIDAESQLIASIMSKKLSVSSTHILIDIPVGPGAKVESQYAAKKLKRAFERHQRRLGVKIRAIITDGSAPIGNGIGPVLEARDVLWLLKNDYRQPYDLREKAVMMAGLMLEMAGKARKFRGKYMAENILHSGAAYDKMVEIIKAQGMREINPEKLSLSKHTYTFRAKNAGKIVRIDNKSVSKVARVAGAPANHKAGLFLKAHVGDHVTKGKPLFVIYGGSKERLRHAKEAAEIYNPYHIHY